MEGYFLKVEGLPWPQNDDIDFLFILKKSLNTLTFTKIGDSNGGANKFFRCFFPTG